MADWGNPPLGSVAIQSGFGSGVELIFSGPPSRDRHRVLAKAMHYHLQGQVLIRRGQNGCLQLGRKTRCPIA